MKEIRSRIRLLEKEVNKDNATDYFTQIIDVVNQLLAEIRLYNSVTEIQEQWDMLRDVHGIVSILTFVDAVELPGELNKFISDFDRVDDPMWQQYLFDRIKPGIYSLQGEPALYERFPRKYN